MLLALDVGNTHVTVGLFDDERLLHHWRLSSDRARTGDEFGLQLSGLMRHHDIDPGGVHGIVLACVVPPLLDPIVWTAHAYFGVDPLVVTAETHLGLTLKIDTPREVGADRLVNSVAAMHRYRLPAIVVDLGTSTNFDVVSNRGEYLGGVISPGIGISLEALFARASKLPRVSLRRPPSVIGSNTLACIESGIFYGTVGEVDEIVRRIKAELDGDPIVIGTGGLAGVIAEVAREIDAIDPDLTLEGLRLIYALNTD